MPVTARAPRSARHAPQRAHTTERTASQQIGHHGKGTGLPIDPALTGLIIPTRPLVLSRASRRGCDHAARSSVCRLYEDGRGPGHRAGRRPNRDRPARHPDEGHAAGICSSDLIQEDRHFTAPGDAGARVLRRGLAGQRGHPRARGAKPWRISSAPGEWSSPWTAPGCARTRRLPRGRPRLPSTRPAEPTPPPTDQSAPRCAWGRRVAWARGPWGSCVQYKVCGARRVFPSACVTTSAAWPSAPGRR